MSARAAALEEITELPKRTITVIIYGHGKDIISNKYNPKHVRILSAAGIPGCYNFNTKGVSLANMLFKRLNKLIPNPNENIPSIEFIKKIQIFLSELDRMVGYDTLDESMEELKKIRSAHNRRYIPLDDDTFEIARMRTTRAIYNTDNKGRFSLIKPKTEHGYRFEPKSNIKTNDISQGIYVIHMTGADNGSEIRIGDNLAEEKFNINSTSLIAITPSSIHDINMQHTNFVKRQLNKYNDLAAYYKIFLNINPFDNQLDMSNWIDAMYPGINTPEHKIYKFGCMKIFADEPEFRQELRACMCAKYLGDKFKGKDASDVLKTVLEKVNILTPEQKPKFQTGLKPEEYENMFTTIKEYTNELIKDIVNTCKEGRIINTMMPYIGSTELIDTVSLSTTVEYLKGLGYDNVNIIDFSCRVDKDATEAEMDAAAEEERKSPISPTWGGNINGGNINGGNINGGNINGGNINGGKTKIAQTYKQYKNKNQKTKKRTK